MNDRDPEFATKAVAIIELLLSPPTDGPLYCVDEKPGIGVRRPTVPAAAGTSSAAGTGQASETRSARAP
jgi:hypothetical protein